LETYFGIRILLENRDQDIQQGNCVLFQFDQELICLLPSLRGGVVVVEIVEALDYSMDIHQRQIVTFLHISKRNYNNKNTIKVLISSILAGRAKSLCDQHKTSSPIFCWADRIEKISF